MNVLVFILIINVVFWSLVTLYCLCWNNNPGADTTVKSENGEEQVHGILRLSRRLISFLPARVKSSAESLVIQVFYTRNCIFQVLYVLLVVTGHVIVINDGLLIMNHHEPDTNHLFWPLTLLSLNFLIYLLCCYCDPGEINQQNVTSLLSLYQYDEIMYESNKSCTTCHLIKPARSKHCSVYNRCIYKFDHYCIWIRNVVGGNNHRYFLLLLFSLVLMCVHGAYATARVLNAWAESLGIREGRYVDGITKEPVELSFLLFVLILSHDFPRLMFVETGLIVLSVMIGAFFLYHCFLALTNQTTNERYKLKYLNKKGMKPKSFSSGLLKNIIEECFPLQRVTYKVD